MRILWAVGAATTVLGAAVAVSAAQAPIPTVTVTASATAVSASPTPIAPGATRFVFTSTEKKAEMSVVIAAPKPGRTADDVVAAVRAGEDAALETADIVASAPLPPGAERAVTVEIKPNTSYLLIDDAGKESTAEWIVAPLATGGAPTGATVPEPDAEVLMRDVRFAGDRTLPRKGTIRVRNIGWAPHFTLAARLKGGSRRGAVARALRADRQRALGRLLDFRNTLEVSSILTRGASADYDVTFGKRGRYVLVCFIEGHNTEGMYRFVRVR
jgi:uncharacterized cupredoxin-like copper-binding protein